MTVSHRDHPSSNLPRISEVSRRPDTVSGTVFGLLLLAGLTALIGPGADLYLSGPSPTRAPHLNETRLEPNAMAMPRPRWMTDRAPVLDMDDIRLQGLSIDRAGRGYALLSISGSAPTPFEAGVEIGSSIRLASIDATGVQIVRSGFSRRLPLEFSAPISREPVPQPAIAAEAPPPAPATPPIAGLLDIQYYPRILDSGISGLVVQPSGTGAAFGYLGLRPGDVVVAIDGRPIDSPEQARTAARVLHLGGASVDIERSGTGEKVRLTV